MANQPRDWSGYDHVGAIISYESGEPMNEQTIELFQYLLDTGMVYHLQGSYHVAE